jgi:hypothetical protein
MMKPPADDYRPQVRLLNDLIQRVQKERDRLGQEASAWRDHAKAIQFFITQHQVKVIASVERT